MLGELSVFIVPFNALSYFKITPFLHGKQTLIITITLIIFYMQIDHEAPKASSQSLNTEAIYYYFYGFHGASGSSPFDGH